MESNDIQRFNKILPLGDDIDTKSTWKTYFTLGTKQIRYKIVDSEKDMYWDDNEQGFVLPDVDLSNKKCFYLITDLYYTYGCSKLEWSIHKYKNGSIIRFLQNTLQRTKTIHTNIYDTSHEIPPNSEIATICTVSSGKGYNISVYADDTPLHGKIFSTNFYNPDYQVFNIFDIKIKKGTKNLNLHPSGYSHKSVVTLAFYSSYNTKIISDGNVKFKIFYTTKEV